MTTLYCFQCTRRTEDDSADVPCPHCGGGPLLSVEDIARQRDVSRTQLDAVFAALGTDTLSPEEFQNLNEHSRDLQVRLEQLSILQGKVVSPLSLRINTAATVPADVVALHDEPQPTRAPEPASPHVPTNPNPHRKQWIALALGLGTLVICAVIAVMNKETILRIWPPQQQQPAVTLPVPPDDTPPTPSASVKMTDLYRAKADEYSRKAQQETERNRKMLYFEVSALYVEAVKSAPEKWPALTEKISAKLKIVNAMRPSATPTSTPKK